MSTLRDIRSAHYITQQELADLANVSKSSVVRMENPSRRTRKDIAEKILKALSKKTKQRHSLETVEGLNIYSFTAHRRQRTRKEEAH